jgi:hypothetical protein
MLNTVELCLTGEHDILPARHILILSFMRRFGKRYPRRRLPRNWKSCFPVMLSHWWRWKRLYTVAGCRMDGMANYPSLTLHPMWGRPSAKGGVGTWATARSSVRESMADGIACMCMSLAQSRQLQEIWCRRLVKTDESSLEATQMDKCPQPTKGFAGSPYKKPGRIILSRQAMGLCSVPAYGADSHVE